MGNDRKQDVFAIRQNKVLTEYDTLVGNLLFILQSFVNNKYYNLKKTLNSRKMKIETITMRVTHILK